jgi:hypothetical protein
MSSKKWGGSRAGAGRKPTDLPKMRRVLISLLPEQVDWLEKESQRTGQSIALIVRLALQQYKLTEEREKVC